MDIAVSVRFGMFRIEHIHFVKMFCSFRTVFKHGAHGSIAVNIGIFSFYIAFFCVRVCYVFKCFHKTCIHVSDACSFSSVKNIAFSCIHISVWYKHTFNIVLYLLNSRSFYSGRLKDSSYFTGKRKTCCVWLLYTSDINYQIKADNSSDRTIKLSDFYNDLESGEYRLVYGFRVNGIGIEKGIKYGAVNFNLEKTEFAEEK